MSVVAGTAEHGVFSIDFFGEKHTVAVEGQKGILALEKFLEVKSVADTDCGAMVSVAPCNPVAVADKSDTRVVFISRVNHLGIPGLEHDRLMLDVPVHAIAAETGEDIHLYGTVIATEHTGKAVAERNYSAVEYTV